ncbi:MAG: hypothetical protein SGILL_006416 [Bacillariaceae sp.]
MTKKIKERDQRADLLPGAALSSLLAGLSAGGAPAGTAGLARFIFGVTPSVRASTIARAASAAAGSADGAGSASSPFNLLDSDDDEAPFSLLRNLARRSGGSPTRTALRGVPMSFSGGVPSGFTFSTMMSTNPQRQHASNANDASAGASSANPLEIDLDSSEEDCEIVDVPPTPHSASSRSRARRSSSRR